MKPDSVIMTYEENSDTDEKSPSKIEEVKVHKVINKNKDKFKV